MPTFLRLVAVLWAGSLMTACVAPTEFTSPLADPGTVEIDRRLVGTWYGVSRCESEGNEFHPCARSGGQPAMLTTINIKAEPGDREVTVRATALALDVTNFDEGSQQASTGRVLQLQATAHPASIDGVTYYNIRRHAGIGYDYTGTGESPHFIIAQAELQGEDTLYLRILQDFYSSFDAEGSTRRVDWRMTDSYFSYPLVDATREQLIAKLRTTDRDELFPYRVGPFRRLTTRLDATGLETTVCEPDDVRRAARFVALRDAAYTLARLGLARQSREAAVQALEMDALGVSGRYMDISLGKVIEALAMAGDHELARDTLERAMKKHGLSPPESLICAQARVGPVPDAVRMAEKRIEYARASALQFEYARASALQCIAVIQVEKGDRCGALTTAHSTGEAWALTRVAEAFRKAGDTAAAFELLSDAAALSAQDSGLLLSIARDQAEWGDADAARKTLRHAASAASEQRDDTPGRPPAPRIEIAELQAQLGDRDAAQAMLEPMLRQIQTADIQRWPADPGFDSVRDIASIIALQLRLGDPAGARQTLDKLVAFVGQQGQHLSAYDRYGSVALAHAAMGDLPAALEVTKNLGGFFLYEIAAVQRKNGDAAGASQTLKFAVGKVQEEAQERLSPWTVVSNPMGKARVHMEADDQAAAAFYIALAIEGAMQSEQVQELLKVAEAQRDLGEVGGARSTALHAMSIAERMPLMEEGCDSGLLLDLLGLPELETKANQ